jgi:hypothetical protein
MKTYIDLQKIKKISITAQLSYVRYFLLMCFLVEVVAVENSLLSFLTDVFPCKA